MKVLHPAKNVRRPATILRRSDFRVSFTMQRLKPEFYYALYGPAKARALIRTPLSALMHFSLHATEFDHRALRSKKTCPYTCILQKKTNQENEPHRCKGR